MGTSAAELRPGGQAVDARGVARDVIRRMGLDAAVRAARTETAGAYTVDADDVFGDRIARPEPDWDLGLIERAINGVELPDYTGAPDSGD